MSWQIALIRKTVLYEALLQIDLLNSLTKPLHVQTRVSNDDYHRTPFLILASTKSVILPSFIKNS